jgi:diguanylate cyclase (GGDEF)-like protein
VVLNHTDLSQALVYAERIRKEIEQLGRILSNRFPGLSLTVSAGVSGYQKNVKNRDALISQADKALYKAKETGRNKVVMG